MEQKYNSYDEIPDWCKHLYKQDGDVWVILQSHEVKTPQDVANVQEGLRKEREDHKITKTKLREFGDLEPSEVHAKLDKLAELEATGGSGNGMDETKLNDLVEARIRTKVAPLEREINTLQTKLNESETSLVEYQQKERTRTIQDKIRSAAQEANVVSSAVEDALLIGLHSFDINEEGSVVTKDGIGVTPGVPPEVWLTEIKQTRPHWWPESKGVGAIGGEIGRAHV